MKLFCQQGVNSGPQQQLPDHQQHEDPSLQSGGYGGEQKRSIKDRLGSIPPPHKLQLNNRLKTIPTDSDTKVGDTDLFKWPVLLRTVQLSHFEMFYAPDPVESLPRLQKIIAITVSGKLFIIIEVLKKSFFNLKK